MAGASVVGSLAHASPIGDEAELYFQPDYVTPLGIKLLFKPNRVFSQPRLFNATAACARCAQGFVARRASGQLEKPERASPISLAPIIRNSTVMITVL